MQTERIIGTRPASSRRGPVRESTARGIGFARPQAAQSEHLGAPHTAGSLSYGSSPLGP